MNKACACLLAALALLVAGAGWAGAADPLRVSTPVNATEFDVSVARTYGAPGFAVDPEDPLHVFATAVDLRTQRCGLLRSTDGGQSWQALDASPSLDAYPLCLMTNSHTTQGKIAFGSDQTLYYALNGWDTQDEANRSIFLGRSTDFGESWQTTIVQDARGRTGEDVQPNRPLSGLAVDTRGEQDVVYITWREQNRLEDPNGEAVKPTMAVSTDGGATFAEPVHLTSGIFDDAALREEALKTTTTTAAPDETTNTSAPSTPTTEPAGPTTPSSLPTAPEPSTTTTTAPPAGTNAAEPGNPGNFGGSNPVVAVDDEGTVYSVWVTAYDNISPSPESAHFLSRSSDRGATFEVSQITPYSAENVNSFGGIQLLWSPEGGDAGTLHMVYEASRTPEVASEADIFYRQSTDRGDTWSDPVVMNDDDPEQLYFSGIPQISMAPNGRLDVAWFDTRSDPGLTANDVYYTSSSDNGATWIDNMRITERSINRKIGVFATNHDLNAPPGIASTDAYALVGWDDTSNFDEVTQGQDIYVAAVQYEALTPATSNLVKYLLAGVIGLVVTGLVFLVLSLVARRRTVGARLA